nr:hypothetical protein [Maliibacterium massiliense]
MRNRLVSILLGVGLVGVGVAVLGNLLSWWQVELFFDGWWTLFLIVPALCSMLGERIHAGNAILLAIGVILLLRAQRVISSGSTWQIIVIAVLIVAGLSLILGGFGRRRVCASGAKVPYTGEVWHNASNDSRPLPRFSAVLCGINAVSLAEDLQGATISAVLGGCQIDLSRAGIHRDIEIQASAILGGVEIRVPQNVRLRVYGTPVLGGCENKAFTTEKEDAPMISVRCTAVLGGVEILNGVQQANPAQD